MYVFGKTIETTKGTFQAGQPLPLEWTGKETIRQLRERYGSDVLVAPDTGHESLVAMAQDISALKADIKDIKEALGLGKKKEKLNA